MASKPSIPKGTRDFSPIEVAKRQYIISIIKNNFEKYGFQPIETPSFENSDTLMGKYGEEGDRLIFKILNSGDFFLALKVSAEIYLTKIYGFLIDEVINNENEIDIAEEFNSFDKKFLNVRFVNKFLEKLNERNMIKDSEIEFSNFFDSNFKRAIINEIGDRIKSEELNDDLFLEIKNKCIDCKASTDEDVKHIIRNMSISTFGRWFRSTKSANLTKHISEKALRYDLTVPFARYVVQHQNEIEFPFKRYQIQPVWRADRPQKGRFREFYQCDADVVGSKSLWQEVELVQLYDAVFSDLGLKGVTIKINNRKILSGIAEVIGAKNKLIDFTVALDKLDKIGENGVKKEMIEKGISENAIEKVQPLFNFTGSISDKINQLSSLLASSDEGMKGVAELQFICDNVMKLGLKESILDLDVTLARGLNYYTGAIFEVAPPKSVAMGSIGGGGRYDDLTGIFGLKDVSGVGISFGLDRIYLVIEELNLFPETVAATSKALFINYGEKEAFYALQAIQKLRVSNVKVELYPDNIKVGKQFMYADKRQIPFAVIVGETEMNEGKFALKNLVSGEQVLVDFEELKNRLS
jgi:histidyl-tRNA synthetase